MIVPHLPDRFVGGLRRFFEHGIIPGRFLTAVLNNDLCDALGQADVDSVHELPGLVGWIYSYGPAPAWGSPEGVRAWAKEVSVASRDGSELGKQRFKIHLEQMAGCFRRGGFDGGE